MNKILILLLISFLILTNYAMSSPSSAQDNAQCPNAQRECILGLLEQSANDISNNNWRDQIYREYAKTLAFEGNTEKAIKIVDAIQNNDTKALTIRGIGMAAADKKLTQEEYNAVFSDLRISAEKIKHPPSYAIALTYIAMAQAFAGDNQGAWKTASDMENDALRHKAFGETAEIQAEKGNYNAAAHSISQIESESFRNKAYALVAKILADKNLYQDALKSAHEITNAYKKAQAYQYILDKQKPREK